VNVDPAVVGVIALPPIAKQQIFRFIWLVRVNEVDVYTVVVAGSCCRVVRCFGLRFVYVLLRRKIHEHPALRKRLAGGVSSLGREYRPVSAWWTVVMKGRSAVHNDRVVWSQLRGDRGKA
jgi:hypothetical protein